MRKRLGVLGAVMTMAASLLVILAPRATAATLKADYQFENSRSSSAGSAPALTDLGTGTNSFATETVDGASRTVLTFPQGNGLDLTPAAATCCGPTGGYTIVILFRFEKVTGYNRLLDFKNGTSDIGLYVHGGFLNFYGYSAGPTASISPNTYVQVVLTRDENDNVTGYVNGAQEFTFVDSADAATVTSDHLRFFQDDNTVGGEQSAGAVARIRLFEGAMTASQVSGLDRAPGSSPPPEDSPPPQCETDPNAICEGDGDDEIQGTAGDDFIFAGGGDDTINGGGGDDIIIGASGTDTLSGGGGDDELTGGSGDDVLMGDQTVTGRTAEDVGADTLDGGAGNDTIQAGGANDTAIGGAGADEILGQDGNDTLNGGGGNDVLKAGAGTNVLKGGPGSDKCVVTSKDSTASCETIKKKRRNF